MGLMLDKRHNEPVTLTWPNDHDKIDVVRERVNDGETLAVYTYSFGNRNPVAETRHHVEWGDRVQIGDEVFIEYLYSKMGKNFALLNVAAPRSVVINDRGE